MLHPVAEPGVGQMGLSPTYGPLSPLWRDFRVWVGEGEGEGVSVRGEGV